MLNLNRYEWVFIAVALAFFALVAVAGVRGAAEDARTPGGGLRVSPQGSAAPR